MNFITSFPRTPRQHDSIMVVVDRLRKVAQFISVKSMYSGTDVAKVFNKEIVRFPSVPNNIILDIDATFTFKF